MITSHHSFSTRIFPNEVPAAHAGPAQPATEQPENLREFWWFLRGSQPKENGEGPRPSGPLAPAQSRPAETRALHKG